MLHCNQFFINFIQKIYTELNSLIWFCCNDISNNVGYLMPKLSLWKNSSGTI